MENIIQNSSYNGKYFASYCTKTFLVEKSVRLIPDIK